MFLLFFVQDWTSCGCSYWMLIPYTYIPRPDAKHCILCGARPTGFARMGLVLENVLAKDTRCVNLLISNIGNWKNTDDANAQQWADNNRQKSVNRHGFYINAALRTAPIGEGKESLDGWEHFLLVTHTLDHSHSPIKCKRSKRRWQRGFRAAKD